MPPNSRAAEALLRHVAYSQTKRNARRENRNNPGQPSIGEVAWRYSEIDSCLRAENESVEMAEMVLFHHAQGLTPGVAAFADELRRAGHTVHTPDLFEGRTFGTLKEG